jgi:hypothetical protein
MLENTWWRFVCQVEHKKEVTQKYMKENKFIIHRWEVKGAYKYPEVAAELEDEKRGPLGVTP